MPATDVTAPDLNASASIIGITAGADDLGKGRSYYDYANEMVIKNKGFSDSEGFYRNDIGDKNEDFETTS